MKLAISEQDAKRVEALADRVGLSPLELLGKGFSDMLRGMEKQVEYMEARAKRARAVPKAEREKLMKKVFGDVTDRPKVNPEKLKAVLEEQREALEHNRKVMKKGYKLVS